MRSLSSFVVELDLSRSSFGAMLRGHPGARIELLPLSTNGAGHPHRFLVSATGRGKPIGRLAEDLHRCFENAEPVLRSDDAVSFTADAPSALLEAVRTLTDGALADGRVQVVFRPALVTDGRLLVAGIVVRGAFEALLRDACKRSDERGLPTRLVRFEPFMPGTLAEAAYEGSLTPKQSEILRMAVALGHYDAPRGCTLDDLASLFGISKAAAADRIRMAERKVLSLHFQ